MRGKIITLVLLGFSICFLTVGEAVGQDRIGETVRIETVDGNLFVGQIVDEDDQKVVLKVEGIGEITRTVTIGMKIRREPGTFLLRMR